MDDTLYPERQYVRSGYAAVAGHLAGSDAASAEAMADWMWRRFTGQLEGVAATGDRMFDALSQQFDLGLDGEAIARLVEVYRLHRPTLSPHADAVALLDDLRAASMRLGLLSDGFLPAQRYKLEALGLADRFEAVVFTEEMGRDCWKPSPAGFERIARELDAPHEACVYIGDNPAKDFVAPNALGWLSVLWRREGQVHVHKSPPPGGEARCIVDTASDVYKTLIGRTV